MTTHARSVHLAALVAVLASVLTLAGPAAPPAAAETCDGVWVVVDARAAGGSLSTRCAPGSPTTGLAALEQAGYAYAFVPSIPGMVCTIDARPDPCNGAPASAYWSYWYAEQGGSWTYATVGAGARTPPPGSVEGWRFGDGSAAPGTAPPTNPPPPTEPADADDDVRSADDGSSGGANRSGSEGGGGGSDAGGTGSAATDSAATGSATARDSGDPTEAVTEDGEAAPDETTTPTDDSDGQTGDQQAGSAPTWRPDPVTTGEWGNPPADVTAPPEPAEEQHEATGPAAEEGSTPALASHRSDDGDPSAPVGGAVGLGLLAGIAALTWRQRLRRTGSTS
ncbi:MAG: hypothetical protein EA340_13590 [Nitriliruptor sp.]|nr:MAG: hypothetical protein EA340_13590 [Nitriliruptor sp.]